MLTDTQVVWRLFLAAALGGIIGFEREKHNKRIAGLRTHILVSMGSSLIMLVQCIYSRFTQAKRLWTPQE